MSLWSYGEKVYADKLNLKTVIVSSSQPTGVSEGQLWYDTVNKVLKVFDGTAWKTLCAADALAGDFIPVTDNAYSLGIEAKRWNALRLSGVTNVYGFGKAHPYKAPGSQTVSGGTTVKIQYQNRLFDALGEYDTTQYRFTASKSGYYFVYAQVHVNYNPVPDEGFKIAIRKNGSEIAISEGCVGCGDDSGGSNYQFLHVRQVATLVYLGAGDYIEFWITNYNSVPICVDYNAHESFALIVRVM